MKPTQLANDTAPWLIMPRMMSDARGETRFVRVAVPQEAASEIGSITWYQPPSAAISSDRIRISHVPAGTDIPPHAAPERQFVVVLAGTLEVTPSDGECRLFCAGAIFLATDAGGGKGHRTRTVDGGCVLLLIPVGEDVDLDAWIVA